MDIKRLTVKAYTVWRDEGIKTLTRKSIKYLTGQPGHLDPGIPFLNPAMDICNDYAFAIGRVRMGKMLEDGAETKTINWFVPDLGAPGAGGHLNIFRCVAHLSRKGWKNRIYFSNTAGGDSRAGVRDLYEKYYAEVATHAPIYSAHFDDILPAEAAFATSWQTAYNVKRLTNCRKKFYFVSDFEPMFFPCGGEYVLAENTYKWGFIGVTASSWLKEKLETQYGMKCYDYGFSYEKDLYCPQVVTDKQKDEKIVFVYVRPSTARRAFVIAMLACQLIAERMPAVRFIFAGEKIEGKYQLPFQYEDAGIIPLKELPYYYSKSDICVALSCSNLSLLPLEIMGCRSVVMSNDDEQVRWLLNEKNSLLVPMVPERIADSICDCLTHPEKLEAVRQAGYEFARTTSWEDEYAKVEDCLLKELRS